MLTWLIRKTSTLCVPCELKLRIEPWAFRSKVCLPDHSLYCSYCHYHDHDEVVVMVLVGRVLLLQIPVVRCLFFSMLQSCMVLTVCLPHHSLYCSLWHYHDHDKIVVMVLVGRVLLLLIPMVRCLGFFQCCRAVWFWHTGGWNSQAMGAGSQPVPFSGMVGIDDVSLISCWWKWW